MSSRYLYYQVAMLPLPSLAVDRIAVASARDPKGGSGVTDELRGRSRQARFL